MASGCKWPDICKLGRHDPEFKGKGAAQGGGKGTGKSQDPASKSGKSKGDAKGKGKGADGKAATPAAGGKGSAKLPDDAVVDELGRRLCYKSVHGKCTDPDCLVKRYHGKPTPAMTKKRIEDEKKMAAKRAAGGAGAQSDSEAPSGSDTSAPGASAKAKAKAAKAKAEGK